MKGNGPAKLNVRALAYTCATLCGLYLFLAALFSFLGVSIPFMNDGAVRMVEDVFSGYSATPAGAVIGLIYGFIGGGIWGGLVAWAYNKFI